VEKRSPPGLPSGNVRREEAMKSIGQVMKSPVVTARPGDTLADLVTLSRQRRIGHFPVVEGDKVIGIVSDRSLREASTHPAVYNLLLDLLASLDRGLVEQIMIRNVITTPPDTPVVEAVKLMREHRIGCLPVVRDGKLVGIVTASDLLWDLAAGEGQKQG